MFMEKVFIKINLQNIIPVYRNLKKYQRTVCTV